MLPWSYGKHSSGRAVMDILQQLLLQLSRQFAVSTAPSAGISLAPPRNAQLVLRFVGGAPASRRWRWWHHTAVYHAQHRAKRAARGHGASLRAHKPPLAAKFTLQNPGVYAAVGPPKYPLSTFIILLYNYISGGPTAHAPAHKFPVIPRGGCTQR